jgi:predicted acylesterase/phospholipase RssA
VLVLSGGGSFGAVEVGILKSISDERPFDLMTGVSAGALNVGFLSSYSNFTQGLEDLSKVYSSLKTRDVYLPIPTKLSLFDNKRMLATISNLVPPAPSVVKTVVAATNLNTGRLDYFNYHNLTHYDKVDALISSSSIPILFQPHEFNHTYYVDGGTQFNEIFDVFSNQDGVLDITFISTSSLKSNWNPKEINFKNLVSRVVEIHEKDSNDAFSKLRIQCENPRGKLVHYYPLSQHFEGYNWLDFNSGKELIELASQFYTYDSYSFC